MTDKLQRWEPSDRGDAYRSETGEFVNFYDVEMLLEEFIKMYSDAVAAQRFRHGTSVERVYALEEVADMAAKALGR